MIIGLTGKYCAGKNHVAALLEARGIPVLDVDKLGHKVIELEKDKITALFSEPGRAAQAKAFALPCSHRQCLAPRLVDLFQQHAARADSGAPRTEQLNSREMSSSEFRQFLAQIVFKNPEKLAALEAIVHPVANRLTDEWVATQSGHCVINAALLHRSSMFDKLDKIILVKAPLLTRLFRAHKRDKLPWREIFKRIKSQKDFNKQYLSINARGNSAEIHIVENYGISSGKRGALKLERRINKIIEGII